MKFCLLTLTILLFSGLFAQDVKNLRKIETLYDEAKRMAQAGDREKSMDLLSRILKLDANYFMAHFALADIYHESGKCDLEIDELRNGLKNSGSQFPLGFKFLAQALYGKGEYEEALENIKQYTQIKKSLNPDEKRLLESCLFSRESVKNPAAFQPVNIGSAVNTADDEYWPCLDAEGKELIFTRLIKYSSDGRKLPFPQEDLIRSIQDSGKWLKPVPLDATINTPENEGAQCISADGRLLFFTACGRPGGLGSCDIYMSVRRKGKWSEPVNLGAPVNSNAWESQPSVSADGHFLFFASNRIGGKGKMDIWRAEKIGITPNGFPVYGKVINLEGINTPGDELSPFIHADGRTLYFASDYWPGLGGKDIFKVTLEKEKTTVPVNLGFPINTSDNEEGMIVETAGENAYFTSNAKGFGARDIFSFKLPQNLRPEQVSYVKGKVYDKKTGKTLMPYIQLFNLSSNLEIQRISPIENEGEFLLCLPAGKNYGLSIEKDGYLFCSENFDLEHSYTKTKPLALTIGMDPIEPGKTTVLNNIFFDNDSANLKPESKPQLEELFAFLNNNKDWIIEIGGHTDNNGSEAYNKELSDKRALAVVKYLLDKGIASVRLRNRGYGFSKPMADNSTEEGRAANRRTEFKILEKLKVE